MADQIAGIYDTKQIHELNPIAKLSGSEELLIDNGEHTLRVTVDTMLGYIRDQINASIGSGGGTTPSTGTIIHVIQKDDPDIPIESRPDGHYYLKIADVMDAQLSSGLPRLIKVSPNMRLRVIDD